VKGYEPQGLQPLLRKPPQPQAAGSRTKEPLCSGPGLKASPGTSHCWRLGTARGTAVLPKIAVFTFLLLPPEATGNHNERLWGWEMSSQAGWREADARGVRSPQLGSPSFPLNSVFCIHSKHLKSLTYKYSQT